MRCSHRISFVTTVVVPSCLNIVCFQELDISRNRINILVPEVGNLSHLVWLNAQQTGIGTLPAEIAFCQELETLLLWGNVIESLPETLKQIPKMTTLAINYRSFCSMVDNYMENLLKKVKIQIKGLRPPCYWALAIVRYWPGHMANVQRRATDLAKSIQGL